MDIFDTYATDEKAEVEGRWLTLSKTAKVKIARSGNEAYTAALRKKLEENQIDLMAGDSASEAAAEEMLAEVQAETILVGWEGLKFKGAVMPYSVANARKLLAVKDFRKKVMAFADSFEAFKAKAEVAQGNG